MSDHKPVSALFDVNVRVVDRNKRQRIKEDIMKKFDMLENDFLPQVIEIILISHCNHHFNFQSGDG